jgi:hypothetical protein
MWAPTYDLEGKRRYWKLEEEAILVYRTAWRIRCGNCCGLVRQNTHDAVNKYKSEIMNTGGSCSTLLTFYLSFNIKHFPHFRDICSEFTLLQFRFYCTLFI